MHRIPIRNGLIDPQAQQHKRWRGQTPMHLWQLDIVGGVQLADGRECKLVTDDHPKAVEVCFSMILAAPSTGKPRHPAATSNPRCSWPPTARPRAAPLVTRDRQRVTRLDLGVQSKVEFALSGLDQMPENGFPHLQLAGVMRRTEMLDVPLRPPSADLSSSNFGFHHRPWLVHLNLLIEQFTQFLALVHDSI